MSDLKKKFDAAAKDAKNLKTRPSDDDLLRLYALYKQATDGDVSGDRPGAFDFVNRAKYDAWARLKGTDTDKAMKSYVDTVARLKKLG
jgi:acyl-CoA-binding protein